MFAIIEHEDSKVRSRYIYDSSDELETILANGYVLIAEDLGDAESELALRCPLEFDFALKVIRVLERDGLEHANMEMNTLAYGARLNDRLDIFSTLLTGRLLTIKTTDALNLLQRLPDAISRYRILVN